MNSLAGYDHLLSTSRYPFKGSAYVDPKGSSPLMPTIDVAQAHAYPKIDQPLGDGAGPLAEFFLNNTVGAARLVHTPFVWGEVGIDHSLRNGSSGADIAYDPTGASLHLPMWATAFGQGSGALFWYSSGFVSPRGLWYHYRGFRRFVDRVPWASHAATRPGAPATRAAGRRPGGAGGWPAAVALGTELGLRGGLDAPAPRMGPVAAGEPPWCRAAPANWPLQSVFAGSTRHLETDRAPQTQCSGGGLRIELPLATDLAATISPAATAVKSDDGGVSQYCPLSQVRSGRAGGLWTGVRQLNASVSHARPLLPIRGSRRTLLCGDIRSTTCFISRRRSAMAAADPAVRSVHGGVGTRNKHDLCRWKHLPAAIWPDERYDMSGAWTGSATVVGGIRISCSRASTSSITCPRR